MQLQSQRLGKGSTTAVTAGSSETAAVTGSNTTAKPTAESTAAATARINFVVQK